MAVMNPMNPLNLKFYRIVGLLIFVSTSALANGVGLFFWMDETDAHTCIAYQSSDYISTAAHCIDSLPREKSTDVYFCRSDQWEVFLGENWSSYKAEKRLKKTVDLFSRGEFSGCTHFKIENQSEEKLMKMSSVIQSQGLIANSVMIPEKYNSKLKGSRALAYNDYAEISLTGQNKSFLNKNIPQKYKCLIQTAQRFGNITFEDMKDNNDDCPDQNFDKVRFMVKKYGVLTHDFKEINLDLDMSEVSIECDKSGKCLLNATFSESGQTQPFLGHGDSGSPLFYLDSENQPILIGVYSNSLVGGDQFVFHLF